MSDLETAARDVVKAYVENSSGHVELAMASSVVILAKALENHNPDAVSDSHRALIESVEAYLKKNERSEVAYSKDFLKIALDKARAEVPDTFKHHCVRTGCDGLPRLERTHQNNDREFIRCDVCRLRSEYGDPADFDDYTAAKPSTAARNKSGDFLRFILIVVATTLAVYKSPLTDGGGEILYQASMALYATVFYAWMKIGQDFIAGPIWLFSKIKRWWLARGEL